MEDMLNLFGGYYNLFSFILYIIYAIAYIAAIIKDRRSD